MSAEFDAVFVGGGFFGCALALHLREERGWRVLVVEREAEILTRASFNNQARVHNGYHYPRSLLTALRCRVNFPRFLADYAPAIVDPREKYYAVGAGASKVTAAQFRVFCERVRAPIGRAPAAVRRLFHPDLVEDVFVVRETVFDALLLRDLVRARMDAAGVVVRTGVEARSVRPDAHGNLALAVRTASGDDETVVARAVYNCTYARLNRLLTESGLTPLRLKHEITEMALIQVPVELRDKAITMMCGPFFSLMPFPPRGLHTLSHVRYTPHAEWFEGPGLPTRDAYEVFAQAPRASRYPYMIRDAGRYLPAIAGARYVDSLWEVKTVLPQSEVDDSRPVLYRSDCGLPNLTCVLGGKIDNVYDIMEFMGAMGAALA
jgi:glycine/D-amino acid oxidase-like deaminating enzyme